MARTSLSLASFGYLGAGSGGRAIVGSGVLYNKLCRINGGDVAHEPARRLFYIEGWLISESHIEGIIENG